MACARMNERTPHEMNECTPCYLLTSPCTTIDIHYKIYTHRYLDGVCTDEWACTSWDDSVHTTWVHTVSQWPFSIYQFMIHVYVFHKIEMACARVNARCSMEEAHHLYVFLFHSALFHSGSEFVTKFSTFHYSFSMYSFSIAHYGRGPLWYGVHPCGVHSFISWGACSFIRAHAI